MLVHQLLLRGMLVGLVAGLLAFGFAKLVGEPSVDRAIAFESAQHAAEAAEARAAGHAMPDDDPEIFSRARQSGFGLLTAVTVYGSALGGLFALAFALAYGRIGRLSPRACAALLAGLGFVAVYAVPYLKYPANPPAIGEPATIGVRTGLYFSMIAISILAMLAAGSLTRLLSSRLGDWNAALAGIATFLAMVGAAALLLPPIDEVPAAFPAATLWSFRLASLGIQAVIWSGIGLMFGAWTQRRATD